MRIAACLILASAVSLLATGAAWSQTPAMKNSPAPAAAAAPAAATPAPAKQPCANPDALGIGRVVEIDTTGGPGFGFEHFKQLAAAGHTIGSHTWSHATLTNKKLSEDQRKEEIEKGFSAVKWALGAPPAPFFRFPALEHPPEMVTYLGTRNIAMFSCDLDSFDFKARNAQQVIDVTMKKLDKLGKGIILMHDFHKHTAEALPTLLRKLKAGGYKVVRMIPKAPVKTLPQYDEEILKDTKLPTVSDRPVSSVVQTISE